MMASIGQLSLWIALALSFVLGVLPLVGAQRGQRELMALARPLVALLTLAVVVALGALALLFVRNDFSVLYVASNSNSALPLFYRIAGVWGGHEGSLLLWVFMLVGWALAVSQLSRELPEPFVARVLAVMGWVAFGFLLFMLFTSNPFDRLLPVPADGRDLNPLLQDPGMVAHPPMLYMGYVGFSVAFAFAIAALIGGQLDATWARWSRPWTTAAWMFLTIGIALGSRWAYYELGWGGWWFWDPVENASFMPWLAGTALMHSLAVTEKRASFKAWTVLLAILAFSLSLLGTFLVRSGVLSSVHAFATDPRRGLFILGFLVVAVGGSLALYAWRAGRVGLGQRFAPWSRESTLLANNILLAAALGAVLLGTLYPLFLDALGLGKISVGPPYFNQVVGAMLAPLAFLMGVGPLVRWKGDALPATARRVRWAGAVALAVAVLAAAFQAWQAGSVSAWSLVGYALVAWIVGGIVIDLLARARWSDPAASPWQRLDRVLQALRQLPRSHAGMWLAHFGVALFILGVTGVRTHEREIDVRMRVGDRTELAGLSFEMRGLRDVQGPNYQAVQARIDVWRGARRLARLYPEKRVYRVQQNPMTEAAIHSTPARDLYVSLGDELDDGGWTVRVQVKPLVAWIWIGCLVMALGGLLALTDPRYRRARQAATSPSAPRPLGVGDIV